MDTTKQDYSHRIAVPAAAVLLALGIASSETIPGDAFQKHIKEVQSLLPEHSVLPPLLDLSNPTAKDTGASRAWENKFKGSMGVREHTDPGVLDPAGTGSILTTTNEYATPVWALPAHDCDAVVTARPVASRAHMAYNRRFVYSTFSLKISRVLKGSKKHGIQEGKRIIAAQFGGSIRFPSGHIETFLVTKNGFMKLNGEYLLFLWKPLRSDETYVIAESYLIENGLVFPIILDAHASAYGGMPVQQFETRVKDAIAKNSDAN